MAGGAAVRAGVEICRSDVLPYPGRAPAWRPQDAPEHSRGMWYPTSRVPYFRLARGGLFRLRLHGSGRSTCEPAGRPGRRLQRRGWSHYSQMAMRLQGVSGAPQ
jgi:hypothetical protein